MARLRVHNLTLSVDGYGAGPRQSLSAPLGEGAERLHEWIFQTRSGRSMIGQDGGDGGLNDDLFQARTRGVGATIMGRHMFGPVRGPWPDPSWRGWWGERPPFDHDVFVLTHHGRPDLVMGNATRFHFVSATPGEVLAMATEAARGADVVLGGGVATIRQFLQAGLVDEMHLVIAPVLLGDGERLFDGVDMGGYSCTPLTGGGGVAHVHVTRAGGAPVR